MCCMCVICASHNYITLMALSSSSALSSALEGTRALKRLKTVFGSMLEPCQRRLLPDNSLFTNSVTTRRRSSCNGRF